MQDLLRLRPIRRLAYVCIDTNIFRRGLEERLKRPYITQAVEASSVEELDERPDEQLDPPLEHVPVLAHLRDE